MRWKLPAWFVALALVVSLFGYAYVRVQTFFIEQEAFRSLETVVRLKSEATAAWLRERRGDASLLTRAEFLVHRAQSLLQHADNTTLRIVGDRFDAEREAYGYDTVMLVDGQGGLLVARGSHGQVGPRLRAQVRQAIATRQVVSGDLDREADGHIGLDVVAPVVAADADGEHAIAAVVLRMDAETFLYPMLRQWPVASASAETLLVRRDGDRVLFLNELRMRSATALQFSLPLDTPGLPAAAAVRATGPGTLRGRDYRNANVLAAYGPVAGTEWRIVARIDRSEVLATMWRSFTWIAAMAMLAAAALLLASRLAWKQRAQRQLLALAAERARSDQLLRNFYDLPFVGMSILSAGTLRWLHSNDRLCEILGRPREELLQRTWEDLTCPEDVAGERADLERLVGGESAGYRRDKRFVRRDGSLVLTTVDVRAVRAEDGVATVLVATTEDITERRRMEAALRASEAHFRQLVQTAPLPMALAAPDGTIIERNERFTHQFGWAPEEVPTTHAWFERAYPDPEYRARVASAWREAVAKAVASGTDVTPTEVRVTCKGGEQRHMLVSGVLVGANLLVTFTDLTERLAHERQVERLSRLYLALSRISDAIVRERDTRALMQQVCRILVEDAGLKLAWVGLPDVARGLLEVTASFGDRDGYLDGIRVAIDDRPEGRGPTGRAFREGCTVVTGDSLADPRLSPWREKAQRCGLLSSVALPLRKGDSTVGTLTVYAGERHAFGPQEVALAEEAASNLSFALVVRDHDDELQRYRSGLEEIVRQRTAELAATNESLVKAREAAEAASRSKSLFLANMSHEIRTPMNAILGLTHLVRRETTDPRHQLQLDRVWEAGQHLLTTINDLLDLSKIEAGKITLEAVDFEVEQLATELCDLVAERAEDKGLELVVDLDGVPRALHGDVVRIRQILLNFLGNAVKFTERGHVALRARPAGTPGRIHFEVGDTGIGLSREQQAAIFKPFAQADASTTRKYGGTGLGLAISRHLARLMGGEVGCESEEGKGATFWFEAPLQEAATLPVVRPAHRLSAHARVLVVDDLESSRDGIASQLAAQRLRVDAVASGEAAVAALLEADRLGDPYELALVDWKMPGLDGLEVGHRLQAVALARRPVAILMSASASEPVALLRAAGYAGFLHKPFTTTALYRAVGSAAGGGAVERSRVAPSAAERECQALARRRAYRLLLAEDNELNRDVASALLAAVGMSADWARDGREAVARAEATPYDLVLMDVQMPELSGLDATRAIRCLPGYAGVPILAITASAMDQEREACREAGMNDRLTKPVDPSKFYQKLLQWLPSAPARVQEEAAPGAAPGPAPVAEEALAQACERLAAVDGLDVAAGLRAVLGQRGTYVRLLRMFCADHAEDVSQVDQALAAGNRDQGRLVAHTVKGLAGTLGMPAIQAGAAALERGLLQGAPEEQLRSQARALATSLRALTGAIERALPQGEEVDPAQGAAQVADGLAELRRLLAVDDATAWDVCQTLLPGLRSLDAAAAHQLAREVERFRYPEALEALEVVERRVREAGWGGRE